MKIKNNLLALFVCLSLFTLIVCAKDTSNNQRNSQTSYAELLEKLKKGDTTIDFKALRTSYTETKEYSPYGTSADVTRPLFKAFTDKKYKDAVKIADEILAKNYVEMNSHYVASQAHEALGNKDKAAFHKAIFLGLINSIIDGKDGKSTKTAFEVISVPEEYVVINVLGFRRGGQGLFREEPHVFDILTVTDAKTNEAVKLYFNIDIVFKGYSKMFGN